MMPLELSILNIPGFKLEQTHGSNPVIFKMQYLRAMVCCHCQSPQLRLKDTFYRKIRHESFGHRKVFMSLRTHKYGCRSCGRYFNDRFPGILPYKRSTEAFRIEVFGKHQDGICQKLLAERLEIGQATIERWYQSFLSRELSRRRNNPCPRVLGIDEHFFTRKKGYATTLCDLGKRRVHDVVLGRSEGALGPFLNGIRDASNTKVVVMDLSETYRSLSKKYFPKAKIVSDRFHVIRLIGHHFMKTWQLIDPLGRKNRGLLSLMRRHRWNLRDDQRMKLKRYFIQYPALEVVWDFKNRLCKLLLIKKQTKKQCKRLVPIFIRCIEQLLDSGLEPMKTLGKTLKSWDKEIVRMWRFTKTNGITEGFHNKMEQISRRAYGFRNFNNYRLRVRALCG